MRTPTLVRLSDGRDLCFEEDGDHLGWPVVLFHGGGHSRLFRPDAALTTRRGVRLITVDRPGTGQSTFQPARTIPGWADDVRQLADHLQLDRFTAMGWSMGGPFAVATAAALPDRVDATVLVGALPPLDDRVAFAGLDSFNRRIYRLARRAPWLLVPLLQLMVARRHRDPAGFQQRYYAHAPKADRLAATDPNLGPVLQASHAEATVHGVQGLAQELRLVATAWTIDLSTIEMPVRLIYGSDDHVVGDSALSSYHRLFPCASTSVVPHAGHLAPLTHWEDVLDASFR